LLLAALQEAKLLSALPGKPQKRKARRTSSSPKESWNREVEDEIVAVDKDADEELAREPQSVEREEAVVDKSPIQFQERERVLVEASPEKAPDEER
jgi:hypothetical protein